MRLKACGLVCMMLLAYCASGASAAQEREDANQLAWLQYVLHRNAWESVRSALGIQPDDIPVADAIHDDYTLRVTELRKRTQARVKQVHDEPVAALEQQYRQEILALMGERGEMKPENQERMEQLGQERKEATKAFFNEWARANIAAEIEAEELLNVMFSELRGAIASISDESEAAARRLFRRGQFVEPQREARREFSLPELLRLIQEASLPDGELHGVFQPEAPSPELDELARQIREAMQQYELELDGLVLSRISRSRRAPDPSVGGTVRVDFGSPAEQRVVDEIVADWSRHFDIVWKCGSAIETLLRASDHHPEADRWRHRLRSSIAPHLMAQKWPEGIVDWMRSRPDAQPEQVEAATAIRDEFLRMNGAAQDKVFDAGIRTRRKVFHVSGWAPENTTFAAAAFEYERFIDETIGRFRSILTAAQAEALDAELAPLRIGEKSPLLYAAELGTRSVHRDELEKKR